MLHIIATLIIVGLVCTTGAILFPALVDKLWSDDKDDIEIFPKDGGEK